MPGDRFQLNALHELPQILYDEEMPVFVCEEGNEDQIVLLKRDSLFEPNVLEPVQRLVQNHLVLRLALLQLLSPVLQQFVDLTVNLVAEVGVEDVELSLGLRKELRGDFGELLGLQNLDVEIDDLVVEPTLGMESVKVFGSNFN